MRVKGLAALENTEGQMQQLMHGGDNQAHLAVPIHSLNEVYSGIFLMDRAICANAVTP